MASERTDETVAQTASDVQAGTRSAESVVEGSLARIAALDGEVHAFLRVAKEHARTQASEIDAKRARGEPLGKLAGVTIAIKDAICTRGIESNAASKILAGYEPPYDATVITR